MDDSFQRVGFIRRNARFILFVLGLAIFRTAVADWNYVPSGSMEPTLYPGDVLVVNKLAYGPSIPFTRSRLLALGQPDRGDVITFFPSHTKDCLVKRVIGVPGDKLRIQGNQVWINNKLVSIEQAQGQYWELLPGSRHLIDPTGDQPILEGELLIAEGKYFVMGDNRGNSLDSRFWGLVDESQVIGKVVAVGLNLGDHFTQRMVHGVL
ncbi:signal peptidase I [Gilvimarinus agarilyticus]|uniref:signal peptidase I n=1 Tax=unclassified Gilvimarinus TaxID=2642066 RepID=UPI001C0992FD|nr:MULTISPECIES: signal peptidase I [unclassified Gilvimarinus]MBU2884208.1 signal peptidase I [Gilvimarinus agarilyticus]MDO6569347.1 signal peptidase I [Gilvimarinus sp. 2_MG-2023]MDO6747501.1 signal peptidase I [Gilvimarinus sp. 1_MG-2023]